MKWFS